MTPGVGLALISDSFRRLTGRRLIAAEDDVETALWNAPRAIVAHGTEPDPIFFYGNAFALKLFEATPPPFAECLPACRPSRCCARSGAGFSIA